MHARGALEGADGLQVAEMPDNLIILAHRDTPGVSNHYFLSLEAVNIITANFILFLKFVGRANESFQTTNTAKSPPAGTARRLFFEKQISGEANQNKIIR